MPSDGKPLRILHVAAGNLWATEGGGVPTSCETLPAVAFVAQMLNLLLSVFPVSQMRAAGRRPPSSSRCAEGLLGASGRDPIWAPKGISNAAGDAHAGTSPRGTSAKTAQASWS